MEMYLFTERKLSRLLCAFEPFDYKVFGTSSIGHFFS